MSSENIITGIQPTNNLHIGNYFGAVLPMIKKSKELKKDQKMIMFVADLHSLTIEIDYSLLKKQIFDIAKIYLASGLDCSLENVYLIRQSKISAHSELAWLLNCFTYFGEAKKMTQFKDKSISHKDNINIGLFDYPILMASDIFLYDSKYVPVGEDQTQHLELARNIAIRINNKFKQEIFVVPEKMTNQLKYFDLLNPLRIKSLTNPDKKMSKSDLNDKSKILLTDNPLDTTKKIMSATTDNLANINWDFENQPGITNLLQIYSLLANKTQEDTKKEFVGQNQYGPLKKIVSEKVQEFLTNLQLKLNKISDQEVIDIFEKKEKEANKIAKKTLTRFQTILGLNY